jgi:hypothetical protein
MMNNPHLQGRDNVRDARAAGSCKCSMQMAHNVSLRPTILNCAQNPFSLKWPSKAHRIGQAQQLHLVPVILLDCFGTRDHVDNASEGHVAGQISAELCHYSEDNINIVLAVQPPNLCISL